MSTLRKTLKPAYEALHRGWRRLSEKPLGLHPVAHQGIQRSGTNYFCTLLEQADYRILNRVDPPRGTPSHKHTRWQHDKSTIVMDRSYANDWQVEGVDQVNRLAGYPEGTKHLVIFRPPQSWLPSICRWGIICGWFADEDAFLDDGHAGRFLAEWHGFYTAWADFAERDPGLALICNYDDVRADPPAALRRIDAFYGLERAEPVNLSGGISRVRHSKPIAEARRGLERPELTELIARGGRFDWQAHSMQAGDAGGQGGSQ